MTGKSTVALSLNCTLNTPYNIVKGIVEVFLRQSKPFAFVDFLYQLAIGAASKRTSQGCATSDNRSKIDGASFVGQQAV